MSVRDAVNDVVEAWLRQSEPCCVIKHFVVDVLRWRREWDGENDSERQPEQHESQETVEVTSDERKVGFVGGAGFEAWLAHESFSVDDDSNMNEKCYE